MTLQPTPARTAATAGERMHARRPRRRRALMRMLLGVALAAAAGLAGATGADAGEWVQVSCVNPNGTGAGSQGWVGVIAGGGYGSNTDSNCGPGAPAFAMLSSDAPVAVGSAETLRYIPPEGSTLAGGTVDVSMRADGYGYDASGTAVAYTPEYVYDAANVFFQCAAGLPPCTPGSYDYTGTLTLPAGRSGELYLSAGCGGDAGQACDQGGSEGAWSIVEVFSAQLRLSSAATPGASAFAGSLLTDNAHGASSLTFTATDPEGPGVYRVDVQADGRTLYSATPEPNGGLCSPVGTSGGALMFDSSQPCKRSETLDLAIDTTSLTDGPHTLKVTVTDAAGNSSVVYDGAITTQNAPPSIAPPALLAPASPATLGAANGTPASEHAHLAIDGASQLTRTFPRRALTIAGRLTDEHSSPIAAATLDVLEQTAGGQSPRVIGRALTDANGAFTARVAPGHSRRIVIGYRARAGAPSYSAQASVHETVSAAVTLHITPQRTRSSATIALSGHVQGPLPRHGVLVEMLVHYRGRWEPFRDARTDSAGRFHVTYRFEGALGTFPFRAEVLGEQSSFPYSTGRSAVRYVHTS
jgi:hypothetical protein